ncbi:GTP pyrophosphokinase family protein [Ruminococcus sp.]|uniref:GTP pyrophosphokinase n=1 Tax=Ruminococcus sp. TaxID=41978 RepID=UPI002CADE490|nr:GTP pyrophosphokinase family protein [Ruminococcus sp.]HNZ98163.1 GTP pyrophosphokinase family protein [Ruminococcus sp.]HOH86073.1 GTP pyrophosphokinase family protein [Ruminococcus sp.]
MDEREFYMEAFDNLPALTDNNESVKETFSHVFYDFLQPSHLYDSAIEVVKTYLNILDNEFSVKFQRNPIHNIESRLKSPQSIIGKLQKKGLPLSTDAARKNLLDLAGIRVTCYYISDIYALVEKLGRRDDFTVIKRKDYIKNPKPSGYRSYHMILNVPVYLSTHKEYAPVEIQIRTIAMDFWASLEHQLKYKTSAELSPEISEELRQCAERIAETDIQMQRIYMQINDME